MGKHLDRKSVAELTLPEGERSKFFWDDHLIGFGLKLHLDATGNLRRSFVVQYRHGGLQRQSPTAHRTGEAREIIASVPEMVGRRLAVVVA